MFGKVLAFLKKRKFLIIFVVLVIAGLSYWAVKALTKEEGATSYVLAAVEKGTLINSISGSGQLIVVDQLDLKSKVSGDVAYLPIKNGQVVKSGDVLMQVDSGDEYQNIEDAQNSLETAQLSLERLKSVDGLSVDQAQNSLMNAKNNLEKLKLTQSQELSDLEDSIETAEENVKQAQDDAFNKLADIYLALPDIMSDIYDVFFSYELSEVESSVTSAQSNDAAIVNAIPYESFARYKISDLTTKASVSYAKTKSAYDDCFNRYRDLSRTSDPQKITDLLSDTLETTKLIADTIKTELDAFNYYVEYKTAHNENVFNTVKNYQTLLTSQYTKVNSLVTSVSSIDNNIESNLKTIEKAQSNLEAKKKSQPIDLASAELSVQEKEQNLNNLLDGPDTFDLRSQELTVAQRQRALSQAYEKLDDYTLRAPFDGILSGVNVNMGESVSTGTTVTTLITKQLLAEVSLNEVDIVKIKTGQKVTLTFDAISELSITGQVADIDVLGTTNQGVVSYDVRISFDTQDDRVKPGMSVSAAIITEMKPDVLMVQSSAVKTLGDTSYVEILDGITTANQAGTGVISDTAPKQVSVVVGSSNDSMIEIVSGLAEGDQVIARTIKSSSTTSSSNTSQTKSSSLLQMNGPGAGGGDVRQFTR